MSNTANETSIEEFLDQVKGPLAVKLSSKTKSVRLYGRLGDRFTATGVDDSAALFVALDGRKIWSEDAAEMDRVHAGFLTELGWPRIYCGRTLDQTLDAEKQKPAPRGGTALAQLMAHHLATAAATPGHRAAAMTVEDEGRMWRGVARRGYLADLPALMTLIRRHTRTLDTFAQVHGFDIRSLYHLAKNAMLINRNRDIAKAAWLTARGIGFDRSTDEKWGEPSRLVRTGMDPKFAQDLEAYDLAYQAMHRLAPLESFKREVQPDGRVRPKVRPNTAVTGRLSMSAPALQALPHRRDGVRHIVRAEPGHDFVSVDHSSAELIVLSRFMVDFLGNDSFSARVPTLYQDVADYTGLTRSDTKWMTIAFMYAMQERTLAKDIGPAMAAKVHEAMHAVVPELPAFIEHVTGRAKAGERFETLFGRPLPLLDGTTYEKRHALAANLLIQGSARDAWGLASRRAAAALGEDALSIPLHDEIFVTAPSSRVQEYSSKLMEAMRIDLGHGIYLTGKPTITRRRWAPAPTL